jgi:peptidoglycan/xylan/chitin deacetylase (PgdA/CDA1 family)
MQTQSSTKFAAPWEPLRRYVARNSARMLYRRPQALRLDRPIVSFTFDDFPRSALLTGGAILNKRGFAGTYYVALSLLGQDSPSGEIAVPQDLRDAVAHGHELGCHTYSHFDSWHTDARVFEDSLIRNSEKLGELLPQAHFRSFSYPLATPSPSVKRATARHFESCRSGGQTINAGTADLNQLASYFLEKANGDIETIRNVLDRNRRERGWVIFATHDVAANASPYGCTSEFFDAVVAAATESGARILSVAAALDVIQERN